MSDWQVGDLAVYVGGKDCGGAHTHSKRKRPKGAPKYCRVVGLRRGPFMTCQASDALILEGNCCGGRGTCPSKWRRVVPDEQEACEPEFRTLLKRSKQTVRA